MFSCCLLCSSLFLYVFIVYLSFVFFYFCAASYGIIKNDCQLSVAGLSQLLSHVSGTICLTTFSPIRSHCHLSASYLKHLLCSDYFMSFFCCDSLVNLEIVLFCYLGRSKNLSFDAIRLYRD